MIPSSHAQVALAVAVAVSAAACATDLRSRRIPNRLTFGAAAAAFAFHLASNGFAGLGSSMAGWLVGAAVFFLPFALGGMGAGDLKLMAALGAWLGPASAIWLALYAGVAGGVLAIAVALTHDYLRQALANVWLLLAHWRVAGIQPLDELTLRHSRAPHVAYAVPIFAATVVVVCTR